MFDQLENQLTRRDELFRELNNLLHSLFLIRRRIKIIAENEKLANKNEKCRQLKLNSSPMVRDSHGKAARGVALLAQNDGSLFRSLRYNFN